MEWFLSKGATVLTPVGHSPHYDLIAEVEGQLLRVQVKTSVQTSTTNGGEARVAVTICTAGGNQSWSGITKKFDPGTVDYLFVLTGSGRRWLIPSAALAAKTAVTLGGPKYSEFEIEPGRPIGDLLREDAGLESGPAPGEYPSGQRMAPVKRPAQPSQVRILPPPLTSDRPVAPTKYERKLGQSGHAVVNQKRRITLPQQAFFEAGFENGSRVRVRADGPGRIVLEQVELPAWAKSA